MSKIQAQLSEDLIQSLQGEKIVSLITTDVETHQPDLTVISWLFASPTGQTIHFAVGHKASCIQNITQNPHVVLGVIGAGSCFAVKGTAEVSDIFEGTMKLRVVTVSITSVEDVMFYGGKISAEPKYVKTYNQELAAKLDQEVYDLLRSMDQ